MSLTKEQRTELKKLQDTFAKLEGYAAAEKMSVDEYMNHLSGNEEEAKAFRHFVAEKTKTRKNIFVKETSEEPVKIPYFGSF
jgi:hypothetical protein